MFGENNIKGRTNLTENLTTRLFTELYRCSKISMKAREKMPNVADYFRAKVEAETKIISNEGFLTFFVDATEPEIDGMILRSEPPFFFTTQLIFQIICNTLKRMIDGNLEDTVQAQALHRAYFKLKQNLADETPELLRENPDFVTEDGFSSWLSGREFRERMIQGAEDGSCCKFCGSEGTVTSNGNMWKDSGGCGRSWRK